MSFKINHLCYWRWRGSTLTWWGRSQDAPVKVREEERRRRRLELVEDMLWLCVAGRTWQD